MKTLFQAIYETVSEAELFEMANLSAKSTGLPCTVFVSPKGGAKHGCRVKVCNVLGKMVPSDVFTLTVPDMHVIGQCKIGSDNLADVKDWVELNKPLLIDYWNEVVDTEDFFQQVQHI